MTTKKYDFSGWATRNDVECSDGRIIRKDAFIENDGQTVPLVYNHDHNDPLNVLGHALLVNKPEGVFVYGSFNDSVAGKNAKELVRHGDITSLSIYANKLKQNGPEVLHGAIREVSLVLAGANPYARIVDVMAHGLYDESDAVIYSGEGIEVYHAEEGKPDEPKKEPPKEDKPEQNESEETVGEILDSLTEKQRAVVEYLIEEALKEEPEDDSDDSEEAEDTKEADKAKEGEDMKHNVFDGTENKEENVLSHADVEAIFADAKRYGSLKDSVLAHGITNIDYLFPDAKNVTTTPELITRRMEWVDVVMNGVHHTPFSRIKSIEANLTVNEARAKGYIKGHQKAEEVFSLLRRTTTPQTVYKKQKLDRDDILDITDFDVVAWLKAEMRMMLDEELARAFLVGDGRLSTSDDKINEANIRPIYNDEDLYTIKQTITYPANATDDQKAKEFIKAAVKSRINYKGSGNPTLFTTEDVLTDLLLMEDNMGRVIYDSVEKLATALRVKNIITVPVMEGVTRSETVQGTTTTYDVLGVIVNLADYNVGADKGGAVSMFDDFDIDVNQQKYLIETRCSGALIKPYSAITLQVAQE